jgi:hypothetical protein
VCVAVVRKSKTVWSIYTRSGGAWSKTLGGGGGGAFCLTIHNYLLIFPVLSLHATKYWGPFDPNVTPPLYTHIAM